MGTEPLDNFKFQVEYMHFPSFETLVHEVRPNNPGPSLRFALAVSPFGCFYVLPACMQSDSYDRPRAFFVGKFMFFEYWD